MYAGIVGQSISRQALRAGSCILTNTAMSHWAWQRALLLVRAQTIVLIARKACGAWWTSPTVRNSTKGKAVTYICWRLSKEVSWLASRAVGCRGTQKTVGESWETGRFTLISNQAICVVGITLLARRGRAALHTVGNIAKVQIALSCLKSVSICALRAIRINFGANLAAGIGANEETLVAVIARRVSLQTGSANRIRETQVAVDYAATGVALPIEQSKIWFALSAVVAIIWAIITVLRAARENTLSWVNV